MEPGETVTGTGPEPVLGVALGQVYGVGVGPGDPDLMTVRAHRLISGAEVIAYPVLETAESFARTVACAVIQPSAREIPIRIPMTVEREPAQAAYDHGSRCIAAELDCGRDVVVLCEGDPFFFGSFMYLFSRLSSRYRVEVVPGVSSLTACAAVLGSPLAARNEVLTIVPGTLSDAELGRRIDGNEAVAIIKVGRHLPRIRSVLDRLGLTDSAGYVERATLPSQRIMPLRDAPAAAPYFSMILINRTRDPWL
ncbi:MAG: precorrin-2 C(20)-methyltransferase [Paracoccaceae bacterium]|nr:precorrin-2 C(20)-methyltransferase [Paracoccaceae bacterium]